MKKKFRRRSDLAFALAALLVSAPAYSDVGVTDKCQDDIRDLQDDMQENKDDYTAESRAKANAELAAARTNRVNPAKCRKNIQDARQALREGKRDKKNQD
jgi:hypothetical protein